MPNDSVVLRFSDVTFEYGHNKHILDEASFSLRSGSRITLMGQNGAGKSSLFKMITGEIKPTSGSINLTPRDASIAIARQVMPQELAQLTVREYFATAFGVAIPEPRIQSGVSGIQNRELDPGSRMLLPGMTHSGEFENKVPYNLDKLIRDVFEVVNVDLPLDRKVSQLSGGQQARLLLAHALIQNPDILLLDEPTNNLDQQGIEHLTGFLMMYEKTVIVISHDADFLNAFSDGVLYLDVYTHKIEQYSGNYYDVVEEIKNRIERENAQNARMQAQIKEKRAQAEVFAHKGGKLRAVAKRMRESVEEAEENIVDVRQEDRTIRDFTIPCQEFDQFFDGKILELNSVSAIKNNKPVPKQLDLVVRKNTHIIISGPNGIGKTTMLEKLASGKGDGFTIAKDIKIGYYKQDFSNFNFEQKAYDALKDAMQKTDDHALRSTAAGFLLDGKLLDHPIAALSEGQKGLLSFCRLVLMKPGLLILDEPTNHINFRHLPIIAKALDQYDGAMIIVSHIPDFVSQIRVDQAIDLSSI